MPRSFSSVHLHVVFSTKDRTPYLADLQIRQEVHAYLGGISKTIGCQPFIVGGVADHIHMLVDLGKTISQADLVKEVKRASSIWIKEREPRLSNFAWQGGYGAFSVDHSSFDRVYRYVANQDEHHRIVSFKDEFLEILKEHDLTYDERFIWE